MGWKQEAVQQLLDYLELKNSNSFIILVNGHSAKANWYWASAGKILTATLTGIAEQQGYVKIDNKVLDYIGASWTSLPSNKKNIITNKDLLIMTSGHNSYPKSNICKIIFFS